jgi:hypothetical protein
MNWCRASVPAGLCDKPLGTGFGFLCYATLIHTHPHAHTHCNFMRTFHVQNKRNTLRSDYRQCPESPTAPHTHTHTDMHTHTATHTAIHTHTPTPPCRGLLGRHAPLSVPHQAPSTQLCPANTPTPEGGAETHPSQGAARGRATHIIPTPRGPKPRRLLRHHPNLDAPPPPCTQHTTLKELGRGSGTGPGRPISRPRRRSRWLLTECPHPIPTASSAPPRPGPAPPPIALHLVPLAGDRGRARAGTHRTPPHHPLPWANLTKRFLRLPRQHSSFS